jgi:hypothetical protein
LLATSHADLVEVATAARRFVDAKRGAVVVDPVFVVSPTTVAADCVFAIRPRTFANTHQHRRRKTLPGWQCLDD